VGNVLAIDGPRTDVNDFTDFYWDKMRRMTEAFRYPGLRTRYTYWPDGEVKTIQKSRVTNPVDADVRDPFPADLIPAEWQIESRTYYPTGDVNQITDAVGGQKTHVYDTLGRLDSLTESVDLSNNRTTHYVYDLAGQRLEEYRGWNSEDQIRYSKTGYTATGKIDWVEDGIKSPTPGQVTVGAGSRTDLVYDGYDRLYQTIYPNPTSGLPDSSTYEQFGYDANGNQTTKRNRSGITLVTDFDPMNRERTRTVPDNPAVTGDYAYTVTDTYNLLGQKLTVSADGQTIATTYDSGGRIDYVTDTYGGNNYVVDHTYDGAGNRTGMTWPGGGSLTYTFDEYDRMDVVTSNIPGLTPTQMQLADYTYDTLSRKDFVAFGNGTSLDPSYFADDSLQSLIGTIPGRSVTNVFQRNLQRQITNVSWTVGSPTSQWSESIFSWTPPSSNAVYAPDKLNRYSTVGGVGIGYDVNGNLTSDGTWTFTYDEENRLRTANASGQPTVAYEYDPIGRRRAKTVGTTKTVFLSDGVEEIEERDGTTNAVLRRYAYGKGIDERIAMIDSSACGGRCFYLTNYQGSTIALTNQDGSINQTYGYDPYGNPSTSVAGIPVTGNPFRFTGRRLDPETGLYYYRARYYSPKLGRFLQTDPAGMNAGLNFYAYVNGDPLNLVDPTGLIELSLGVGFDAFFIGGAKVGIAVYVDTTSGEIGIKAVGGAGAGYGGGPAIILEAAPSTGEPAANHIETSSAVVVSGNVGPVSVEKSFPLTKNGEPVKGKEPSETSGNVKVEAETHIRPQAKIGGSITTDVKIKMGTSVIPDTYHAMEKVGVKIINKMEEATKPFTCPKNSDGSMSTPCGNIW